MVNGLVTIFPPSWATAQRAQTDGARILVVVVFTNDLTRPQGVDEVIRFVPAPVGEALTMTEDLDAFIQGLPKAELHLHIEGTLEPEQMFEFARRNKVALPFKSVEEVRAAYAFSNLQDFLDIYYQGAGVLRTEEDFRDLALAYFRRVAADGARHVELFFDPQTHTDRGIPFSVVADGLLSGMAIAERELGVTSALILCFLRHLPEEAAFATLKSAEPYLDRILGVGLDSPDYVREALDLLHVDRIDHGNRALEDAALTARLADARMTLTVCPLSNLKLCVVDDLSAHPLRRMLNQGLRATINSDDPAYFGGYLGENWRAVTKALGLTRGELVTLARNSFTGAFLPQAKIDAHLGAIDAYAAAR
jgi:adenosine deaminase